MLMDVCLSILKNAIGDNSLTKVRRKKVGHEINYQQERKYQQVGPRPVSKSVNFINHINSIKCKKKTQHAHVIYTFFFI